MIKKRREYLTLLALGATGALAGCTDADDDNDELEPVDDDDEEEDEDVVDDDGEEEDEEVADDDDEEEDEEVADDDDEEEDEDVVDDDDEEEDEEVADDDDEEEEDELRQMDLSFGDTVEHPDGFHITPFEPEIVDSFESESFDGTETIEPENEQFVFIEIEIENVIDSTIQTPNALDFQAIVDGQQYERASLIGEQPEGYERYPSLENLAPGSTASGEMIFDTPSGEAELFYSGLTEDFEDVEAIWS